MYGLVLSIYLYSFYRTINYAPQNCKTHWYQFLQKQAQKSPFQRVSPIVAAQVDKAAFFNHAHSPCDYGLRCGQLPDTFTPGNSHDLHIGAQIRSACKGVSGNQRGVSTFSLACTLSDLNTWQRYRLLARCPPGIANWSGWSAHCFLLNCQHSSFFRDTIAAAGAYYSHAKAYSALELFILMRLQEIKKKRKKL